MDVDGKAENAKNVASRAECLFNDRQIQTALDVMAKQITAQLQHENPVLICVMTGGLIVSSELLKRLAFPLEVDYLHATRYAGNTIGQKLEWLAKPKKNLKNRSVLIVDDILDVGRTMYDIVSFCKDADAKNIYSAVLVEKLHDRKNGILKADFTALQVPDRYVFGYGMDHNHYLRNTSSIYAAAKQDE